MCLENINKSLQKIFVLFFGWPYRSNSTKTHLDAALTRYTIATANLVTLGGFRNISFENDYYTSDHKVYNKRLVISLMSYSQLSKAIA